MAPKGNKSIFLSSQETKNQNGGQSEDKVAIAGDTGRGTDDAFGLACCLEPKAAARFQVTQGLSGESSSQSVLGWMKWG